MKKKDLIRSFNVDEETFEKLKKYAEDRAISKSAVLRILINENCS